MKILCVTNTYRPHVGGVAKSVEAFSREFRRHGHEVMIVAPRFDGEADDERHVTRVEAVQKFNGSDFSVPLPAGQVTNLALDDFAEDIVHSHHPFLLGDTALRVAAWRNVPLVFTHHTLYERYTHYVPGDSPSLKRFVIDLVSGYCELCEAVVAPSTSVERLLRERGVTTRIEVIPTGVDVAKYRHGDGHRARKALAIDQDAFVIGHVGRLAPEKNLGFLAKAVSELVARDEKALFLVVGDGPSGAEIKRLFEGRGLAGRLRMTGAMQGQALVDAYHSMNVFAFASQSETQGMVLTEAMAAGRGVVAVAASGVRDVMVDGVNGRMLDDENMGDFVKALEWVRGLDDDQSARLNAEALATADKFSIGHTAERMLALYQTLVHHATRAKRDLNDNPWLTAMRVFQAEWNLRRNQAHAVGEAIRPQGQGDET